MTEAKPERTATEFITREFLARLCVEARRSSRGRINHNYHALSDGYQRMLNVVQPDSYIRPHRHRDPAKGESFVVLQGVIGFLTFDDEGGVVAARRLAPTEQALGVDLQPRVWHCFVALMEDTVVFEAKNGPYDPATDKEFPRWAPAEGDPAAAAYLEGLRRAVYR